MQYYFKKAEKGKDPTTIIFTKIEEIFELNFVTDKYTTIFKYKNPFKAMPKYFSISSCQNYMIAASI